MTFSETDNRLLELLQQDFPLISKPFQKFSEEIGITESEVLERTKFFTENDIVREISGIFELRKLGYSSTLVAAEVDEEGIDDVTGTINAHPGVGHNYLRNNAFNIWFTFAVPPEKSLEEELDKLLGIPHVQRYMQLPTEKTYKINAQFKLTGDNGETAKRKLYNVSKDVVHDVDRDLVRELQKHVPVVSEPFKVMADNLGIQEDELFDRIKSLKASGCLRRIAGVLRHRKVGFSANAMVCWSVDEDKVDATGEFLTQFPEVTHCYRRRTYDFWPYSLYSMIHGTDREACDQFIDSLKEKIEYTDCKVLYSSKEFKKERVKYFIEGF